MTTDPRFRVSGTNGDSPHGMARYGTEWRKVEPVDGVLIVPGDADEFFMVSGGGGGNGGGSATDGSGVNLEWDRGGESDYHIVIGERKGTS